MKNIPVISVATCLINIFCVCHPVYSWSDVATHAAITDNAVYLSTMDDYLKNQLGISQGLGAEFHTVFYPALEERMAELEPERTTRSALEWVKTGSRLEDKILVTQYRPRHHFHDPIRNAGLDNKTDHPEWKGYGPAYWSNYKFDFTGESALDWAVNGTSDRIPTENLETWRLSRTHFYNAMTYMTKSDRDRNMAMALLSLGSVGHLLEDMGVPAHTRNDFLFGHYRNWFTGFVMKWGNDLEDYVESRVASNGGQSPWSGSSAVVFDKLAKYFDANVYSGDYLGDGGLPPTTWGLSECSNYQFLSLSTIFRPDVIIDPNTGERTRYYFPHPAKERVPANLLVPVPDGNKVYFNGSNYGVTHIARESYTYYITSEEWGYTAIPVIDSTNATDDVNVFVDYANITIPRTIDYTTGLVNYFFRGKLEVEPNFLDCNTVTFVIRNISDNSGVEQTLKGGTFEVYWDDRDGNRTQVDDWTIAGWTSTSELGYDERVTGTFAKPDSSGIEKYTVVYKGQINESPDQPDNDDANAIAVGTLVVGYPIIAWGEDEDGIVSNIPEGNDFVDVAAGKYHALAIRSSGSLAAWGWNNYGQCDVPEGNDFVAIAGGVRHSIALKSDGSIVGWGDDGSGQIDVPVGNDFVAIASGDYHNLAITTEGLIVGWGGYNEFGECDAPEPNEGTIYVSVSAGRYHSLALQSDGTIRAWGSNNMGQTRIYLGAGNDHEAIAAADNYNFLLLEDDMLVSWGGGDFIEPGIPDYHYRQPDGHDFVAIAAGGYHILALTADGEILSWGWNDYDPPLYSVPEGVVFTKDVAAGWKFSVALKAR